MLESVLGDLPDRVRPALVRMAITRSLSDVSIAPILSIGRVGKQLLEFRERDMWVTHRDGTEPPTLHPLARRAIAHHLARLGADPVTWDDAHDQLRRAAQECGDVTTARYHQLALGQVDRRGAGVQ